MAARTMPQLRAGKPAQRLRARPLPGLGTVWMRGRAGSRGRLCCPAFLVPAAIPAGRPSIPYPNSLTDACLGTGWRDIRQHVRVRLVRRMHALHWRPRARRHPRGAGFPRWLCGRSCPCDLHRPRTATVGARRRVAPRAGNGYRRKGISPCHTTRCWNWPTRSCLIAYGGNAARARHWPSKCAPCQSN